MARVALIVPSTSYRAPDFFDAARALGVEVVMVTDAAPLLARRPVVVDPCDDQASAASIVDADADRPVDAVIAVDDVGVVAAAEASRRLGLPHNPPEAVAATRDKAAMRARLAGTEVAQPRWAPVAAGDDVAAVAARVGWPTVVKPPGLSGSRGVIRADDADQATAAGERIRRLLGDQGATATLLVESYLDGPEIAVEGLLRHGDLEVLATFDKPDAAEGPFFEETIYVTPSRLPASVLAEAHLAVARAAAALGLVDGPVHAELRLPGGRPHLLEVAARSIGGLCSRTLKFGAGVSLEEVILRHALGLPAPAGGSSGRASGVMMLPIARSGVLAGVAGQEEALAVPGVVGLEITIAPGKPVMALPEGDRYLGFLFAAGDTSAAVEAALRAAHGLLRVDIVDADGAAPTGP
ncbi:MAG TPA: ATP-grasp domain-containing protein [Acidimicrobiales bacterium]|nr:ATP-grasp domain-containing protein [Acidimicrobiales bacterium]